MLQELKEVRRNVKSNIQIIESAVAKEVVLIDIKDNSASVSLINSFDNLYYELFYAIFDVHNLFLST